MNLRPALMLGCALGAFVLSGQARSQAFNADPTTVAGSVGYNRGTPGVETIRIDSASAIINWVPNVSGNPILFLPAGNVATFINGVSNGNYAVLNRIITTVPTRFDGTVLGRLQDPALGTSVPGGTIVFQSPAGIIVGPTALFDVGNLVLTTLNVQDDGAGNFISANGALRFFGGSKFPQAAVITEPGAQIRALEEGSYVALIAPIVQHGGSVRVNGSAAYITGEEVSIRVDQGLFDIIVKTGSDNAVPLVHTGSTGGPASTGAGDNHAIYLVAVPKNQAITAILEGNVGFDAAVNATVENGVIVLSAGYPIFSGVPDRFGDFGVPPVPGVAASFHIRGGTITSDLFGYAVTDMLASGATTGSLAFQQDVSLFGGVRAHLFAGPGQIVTVAGNALVSAAHNRTIALNPIDLVGGEAKIFSQGGNVDIFGNAIVDASAQGVVNVLTSTAGHGTGGRAELFADLGGTLRVRGTTRLLATGAGGVLDLSPNRGGNGQGGVAVVEGRNGGQVRLDGTLTMDASGTGSRSNGSGGIPAATGTGGALSVAAFGGSSVVVAGATSLTANGTGGNVTGAVGVAGGTGRGGEASLIASGTVTLNGDVALDASGFGGTGPTGGTAQGGRVLLVTAPPAGGTAVLNAGNVTGTASATGAAVTGNTPGEWHISNSAGSTINLANLTLIAAANGTLGVRPFSSVLAQGTVNVTQLAQFTTPGEIRILGQNAGRIIGGRYNFAAGEDVNITHTSPVAGGFTIDVTDLYITAGDDFSAGAGVVTRTANQTDIRATDNASVAGTILGRNILIASATLDVTGPGVIGGAATDQTELRTTGASVIAGRVLGRTILVTASGVNVTGAIGDAATQLADIRATGNAAIGGTVLGRAINIQGAAINVATSGIVGGAGTDQTRLTALGNAGVAGRVLGRDIQIASADIDLTGALGDAGTQIVTLQVAPTAQAATLGGAAQGPGYTLTNAEAGRIRADALRINVPALGANPALFVRDLTFNGGGAAAGIGTLAIATPGIARVEGNLLMTGARAADGIALTASGRLEVVTPSGSIRVRDGAGAPAGTMILTSNNLWVASSAIIDRLRLDPNYAGRDADLLDNGGADVPRGYVEAGGVTLAAGGTLFVQNTGFGMGTFATGLDFGGITVGPGGLTVFANAPGTVVTAFGRRLNPDGTFTTGYDFFFAVDFRNGGAAGGAGSYTAASTFNTCIIATRQCAARPPDNSVPGRDPTTGPTGGSVAILLPFGAEEDDLVDTSFAAEPLIEEPVTSGGESTLWNPDCDRDNDGQCDEVQP